MYHVSHASVTPIFLLAAGGSLYYLLEYILRGWSHWTMAVCGGICLFCIFYANHFLAGTPLLLRAAVAALIITVVELLAGCLLNRGLGLQIWDYSHHTGNLAGQISLYASARWFILCIPVCAGCGLLEKYVFVI